MVDYIKRASSLWWWKLQLLIWGQPLCPESTFSQFNVPLLLYLALIRCCDGPLHQPPAVTCPEISPLNSSYRYPWRLNKTQVPEFNGEVTSGRPNRESLILDSPRNRKVIAYQETFIYIFFSLFFSLRWLNGPKRKRKNSQCSVKSMTGEYSLSCVLIDWNYWKQQLQSGCLEKHVSCFWIASEG